MNALIKSMNEFISIGNITKITSKFNELSLKEARTLLYELTKMTISKEFNVDNYLNIIESLGKDNNIIVTSLNEVLWLIGFSLEKRGEHDANSIYVFIVNSLLKKKFLSQNALIELLEESSLAECGIIPDKDSFKKKIIRLNTKTTYEQQKFNLLRETSEGFAKMVFLLFEVKLTKDNIQTYISKILSLIGFFDLDPNRILDLALSAFEYDCYNSNFISIIKILNLNALQHVIGFRLNMKLEGLNMYVMIANLIKYKLLDLKNILPHMVEAEKELEENITKNINNTNSMQAGLHARVMKEISFVQGSNNTEKETSGINANYFVNFKDIVDEVLKKQDNNQLLRLFEGLIIVRDYENAEVLYKYIENYYDPLTSDSLINTLSNEISDYISNLYSPISFNKKDNNEKDFDYNIDTILNGNVNKLLNYLTIGLSKDQLLFTKLIRIIKHNSDDIFSDEKKLAKLYSLFMNIFLPSLSLIDASPNLVTDIWNVLTRYDYNMRYKIYNNWSLNVYTTHPILYLKYNVVLKEASKWQKTLTKDNQRQHGRRLGIMTNSNPVIIFDSIIRLLTNYDNQINIFMQTLSFVSALSYDVITFIIAKILADPNSDKLHTKSGEIASWYKYFCYFIGNFYKKYHFAEIGSILHYLCNKLKYNKDIEELHALKEIIEKMTGIVTVEEMNETQLHSCAGGVYLFLETNGLVKEYKYLKKPILSLKAFFSSDLSNDNNLSFPAILLTLLGIRKHNIIFNSNFNQPKFLGYLYDMIHNIYIQLNTFFTLYMERDSIARLLPNWSLEKYVINYNCQPEVIYFMVRNQIKPIYLMTDEEYQNHISQFSKVLDLYQSTNSEHFKNEYESMYIDKALLLNDLYKNIWKYVTPELYFIFSVLQLKDVYVPKNRYLAEISKNEKTINELMEKNKNPSESDINKNKKEIEKCNINIENLKKEMNNLIKNNEAIISFIDNKKNTLLDDIPKNNKREISKYFIQFCLFPRIVFSKIEALYSAKMLIQLIKLKIQNINVFDIMQKMIKFILPTILCVSEAEAQNIGIFLLEFLKIVSYWQDNKVWAEECFTNPCFSRNLDTASSVDLHDFKKVNICLLSKMNSTFQSIFNSEDYMSCRNALIVLNALSPIYPSTRENAIELTNTLEKAIDKFINYEDLSMMMNRYKDILINKTPGMQTETDTSVEKNVNDKKCIPIEKKKKKSEYLIILGRWK